MACEAYKINNKAIHVERTLYFDEVPIYSVFKDDDNNRFFIAYVDDNLYLVTQTTPINLLQLLKDKITISEYICKHSDFLLVNSHTMQTKKTTLSNLDSEWLPCEGVYLEQQSLKSVHKYILELQQVVDSPPRMVAKISHYQVPKCTRIRNNNFNPGISHLGATAHSLPRVSCRVSRQKKQTLKSAQTTNRQFKYKKVKTVKSNKRIQRVLPPTKKGK